MEQLLTGIALGLALGTFIRQALLPALVSRRHAE